MRLLVTGATGFVGNHLIPALLSRGHIVTATERNEVIAKERIWFRDVDFIACDLHRDCTHLLSEQKLPDMVVHLAWENLNNYNDFSHITKSLVTHLKFIESMARLGIGRFLVAGTCLEYGMQYGPLAEDMPANPVTAYGLAKSILYKSLLTLQKDLNFNLQWIRFFYMYGQGQSDKSLLSQLDMAIQNKNPVFKLSVGDQLRDYLPIESVIENLCLAIETPEVNGVINCCSGNPTSVFDLVTEKIKESGSKIQIQRGFYPYPDYEPLAFWGDPKKLLSLKKNK